MADGINIPILEKHFLDISYPSSENIKTHDIVIGLKGIRDSHFDVARVKYVTNEGFGYDIVRKEGGYNSENISFNYINDTLKSVIFLREKDRKLEVIAASRDLVKGLGELLSIYINEVAEEAYRRWR